MQINARRRIFFKQAAFTVTGLLIAVVYASAVFA
jgi:hypothetical protein